MNKSILIGLLFLALDACTPKPASLPDMGSGQTPVTEMILADTKWKLVSFGEPGVETPAMQGSTLTLEFDADGQASGSGGCNAYSAQYEVQGNRLSFGKITHTLMACEPKGIGEQEQGYFQALETTSRFELAGDRLTIWYDGGQGVLNLQVEGWKKVMTFNGEVDLRTIDEYIAAQMRSARIPGMALAVVKGDQIVYLKGYGQADPAGRPVTPQTPFIIGSITKPFTALAVMQLVEAGKVDLDAPVQRYIPWFRAADLQASAQITVRMLIDQTSGLPQSPTMVTWTWPDEARAIEYHVRLLANAKLDSSPGQSFAYSNANYATLGMIVQAVTGQSYEDYIRQHIFAPLDMQNSFASQDEAIRHGVASGYRWWFGFPVPATLAYNRANLPAGFLISGAEDMAHFLIAQMNGGRYQDSSVLSPDGIALLQAEPTPGAYGMGWESTRIDGRRLINHDGATANYQCSVFIDPQAQVGVFLAANAMSALDGLSSSRDSASLGPRTASEIVRRVLGWGNHKTFLASALITTRGMAHTVLNTATHQPMPRPGPGQRRVSLIFDLLILGLTGALVLSLARVPGWYAQLAMHGVAGWSDLARLSGQVAVLHFAWPLALLYVVLKVPFWIMPVLYQPDLVTWLESAAAVVSVKGLLEIALIWQVFWQIH